MGTSKLLVLLVLLLFIHKISCTNERHHKKGQKVVVNVDDFGTKADGVTEDNEAFEKAWSQACSSSVSSVLVVPKKRRYMLKQLNFTGPCKSKVTFSIKGTIVASLNRSDWNPKNRRLWIVFNHVRYLVVKGGGTIDGNGQAWWPYSCKRNITLPCIGAPTALLFFSCNHLRARDLWLKDSQQFHLTIDSLSKVKVSKMLVTAPEKSPNTDGIHITNSSNVVISNCGIRTGDDCISIISGSKNIHVHKIRCGPGHGISIGSLGKNNSKDHVRNVKVNMATLNATTNGVRIKTWQGGRGYAKNIVFKNIMMHDVENPIIINQYYCDSFVPCHEQRHAVAIKNVLYNNIMGTSASGVAMNFTCSKSIPCRGIRLEDINLVGEGGNKTRSLCHNVHFRRKGRVVPFPCD